MAERDMTSDFTDKEALLLLSYDNARQLHSCEVIDTSRRESTIASLHCPRFPKFNILGNYYPHILVVALKMLRPHAK